MWYLMRYSWFSLDCISIILFNLCAVWASVSSSRFQPVHRQLDMMEMRTKMDVSPLEESYLNMSCVFNGFPVCCPFVDPSHDDYDKFYPHHRDVAERHMTVTHCHESRRYIPSQYEMIHYNTSVAIQASGNEEVRRDKLFDFMLQDIPDSNRWLSRIEVRMKSALGDIEVTADDEKYLSRFEITNVCRIGEKYKTSTWVEWIEPLTIHTRHPFAMGHCFMGPTIWHDLRKAYKDRYSEIKYHINKLENVDHVLIQAGDNLKKRGVQGKHIFMDAGSSTFFSSLFWFTCSYIHKKIGFSDLYAWEYTKIDPTFYWDQVPTKLLPFYHFYNAPVTAEQNGSMSLYRMLSQTASVHDFIAVKLDIDHPETELPIAFQIAKDPYMSQMIDEFFFEFHFQCEFLMYCGFGTKIPEYVDGFKMDRPHVLEFFRNLRERGMRAHMWP